MKGEICGLSGHHIWIKTDFLCMLPVGTVIDFDKHHEKRSKDANSYFHVLVGQMADVLSLSKKYIKNQMVSDYGQMYFYDGKAQTYETEIPPEIIHNSDQTDFHYWLSHTVNEYGVTKYVYQVYRGTRDLDTREFSILLDGVIWECQQLGIETMTPDELLRFKDYERQN